MTFIAKPKFYRINNCGIDPERLVPTIHYDGTPIATRFIAKADGEHFDKPIGTPMEVTL